MEDFLNLRILFLHHFSQLLWGNPAPSPLSAAGMPCSGSGTLEKLESGCSCKQFTGELLWGQLGGAGEKLGRLVIQAQASAQPSSMGNSRGAGLFYHYQSDIGLLGGVPSWGKRVTSQALPGEATPFAQGQHSTEGCSWEPSAGHSSGSWGWARPWGRGEGLMASWQPLSSRASTSISSSGWSALG